MFEAHEAFVAWAMRYDAGDVAGKTLRRHEAYLAEQQCPVLELRGLNSCEQVVAAVLDAAR